MSVRPVFTRVALATAAVAALALGAVLLPQPTAASPAPAPTRAAAFGIASGCCTPAGITLADQADGYAASGAAWVRTGVTWSALEPTRGRYDAGRVQALDGIVGLWTSRDMRVLGVLAYTPAWAADPDCAAVHGNKCAPRNPDDFARFAAAAVERYDGDGHLDAPGSPRVDAWEIWNEPNLANYWRPAPDPAGYARLLLAASSAIRQADPTATIVSGGLSPAGGPHAPIEFLRTMYANGAAGSFDALGFHPYSYPVVPGRIAAWNAWQQMSRTFPNVGQPDSLRTLMALAGDGDKQIWATEYGAPTHGDTNGDGRVVCDADGVVLAGEDRCVTEARQADMVTEAYRMWTSYDWAGPLFWFSYQDVDSGNASIEGNFGLVRTDGSAKPGFAAYVTAAQDWIEALTPQ